MTDYEYRRAVSRMDGATKQDSFRIDRQRHIARDFEHTLDVEDFVLWENGELTDVTCRFQVNDRIEKSGLGYQIQCTALVSDNIHTNQMYYRVNEDKYYLLTDYFDRSGLYHRFDLLRCNNSLRWIDKEGILWEYPCAIRTASQTMGEEPDKNVTLGIQSRNVKTVLDTNTAKLTRDNRFFIDDPLPQVVPQLWQITSIDRVTAEYVTYIMYEEQYAEDRDNRDERIANYWPLPQTGAITFTGKPQIRLGRKKILKADTPDWNVVCDPRIGYITDDTKLTVSTPNLPALVGEKITVMNGASVLVLDVVGGAG